MIARFVVPAVVCLGAAWMLVQPDTPRPVETASVATSEQGGAAQGAARGQVGTAVELLGETWTVDAPAPPAPPMPSGPVVRPLTAAEHAAAIAALQPGAAVGRQPEVAGRATDLRRPVPRPARDAGPSSVATVSTQSAASVDTGAVIVLGDRGQAPPPVLALRGGPADGTTVMALGGGPDAGPRWVVQRQGSGEVVAEVSLAEALAILTSR